MSKKKKENKFLKVREVVQKNIIFDKLSLKC